MKKLASKLVFFFGFLLLLSACKPVNLEPDQQKQLQIHDLQGCAHISPYANQHVNDIRGIVTSKNNQGFYMQDDQPDDLDCSSEGIYIHVGSYPDVYPGDLVSVQGRVVEYSAGKPEEHNLSITEIESDSFKVISSNNRIPASVIIGDGGRSLPLQVIEDDRFSQFDPQEDGLDFFESLESMRVGVESGIVVGPRNSFNEVVIVPPSSLAGNDISSTGALIETIEDPNPERIILNMNQSNSDQVNLGAQLVEPVTGIMDYSYGNYKINTIGKVQFRNTQMELVPSDISEELVTIASYNVENLSRSDPESRFRAIARNIVKYLNNPDVVILHEVMDDSGIEDDGEISARKTLAELVQAISNAGGPVYSAIDNAPKNNMDGGIDGGNIRSIILFREDSGIQLAAEPFRIGEDISAFNTSRKPFVCLFSRGDSQFLVLAVHLTSRGADSPLFGDEQPLLKPEEMKRNLQAGYINQFVFDFMKNNPNKRIVVAGDMNDDPWSKTISALTSGSLENLSELIPENERYSYILDGNAIQLDYLLVSAGKAGTLDEFQIVHINSHLDYVKQTSDHDAVIAGIDIGID